MKPSILLIPAILILLSCNNPFGSGSKHSRLSETAMYNIDSVRAAMGSTSETEAVKNLMQAINVYKNAHRNITDTTKGIDRFKPFILSNPCAKIYFEFGVALLDEGRYDESIRALHMAEQLNYKPLADVMFNLSAAYAPRKTMQEGYHAADSTAMHYMELALQMGYARPEKFRAQDYFTQLRESYEFNNTYNAALSGGLGGKSPDKMLWQAFSSSFPAVQLPLTINTAYIHDHMPVQSISYDYEKFITEIRKAKFSREAEDEYYYFALIKKDPAYTALIYAGKNNFLTDANGNSPVFFFLATYDAKGKIIDKMPVAGQSDFTSTFKVFTMQPNYSFEVKDFKNIFKYDPEQVGYDSNYVVKSDPLGVAGYRIGANGKFEKQDAPLAIR